MSIDYRLSNRCDNYSLFLLNLEVVEVFEHSFERQACSKKTHRKKNRLLRLMMSSKQQQALSKMAFGQSVAVLGLLSFSQRL